MDPQLTLTNIGQIKSAELRFGDLTVFVGPQATGKSIALQLLKLALDMGHVQDEMERYGIDWQGELPAFLDAYLGEGMSSVWKPGSSQIEWKGRLVDLASQAARKRRDRTESLFLIPAQRVMTLREGWPRPFTDFSPGDPFAVREFSERLRTLVELEFKGLPELFPQARRLKAEFRDMLQASIFGHFKLSVDRVQAQKRLVLGTNGEGHALPYMVWSAGQREFVPLLLGLYWLLPGASPPRRNALDWVVIEELEMGLHPQAINTLLLMVLDLVTRGYRVCLSTHSPQVLELAWALGLLQAAHASAKDLLDLFEAKATPALKKLAEEMLKRTVRVHYFGREGVTQDISRLAPDSPTGVEQSWGGLTEFSGQVNEVIARVMANQR